MRFGVSYFGVRDPRHARRDLDEIAEAGFRSVTHTFSEHDLRYHREDVARIVQDSRERGLEVALDPWGVAGLFGGEAYSELALVDVAARQVDARGVSVPAACPNAASTLELLQRWLGAALAMDPDWIFWDEPHFYLGALREEAPAPCCRCPACREAWRTAGADAESGRAAGGSATVDDELPAEGDPRLAAFRSRSLRRLLHRVLEESAPSRARHALCLLPRGEFAAAGTDDWETFAALPGLSRLATDPYWMERPVDPADYVRRHAATLRALCDHGGREMEVWVQGIRIPAGGEDAILAATEAAARSGADQVSFWSFRGTERMAVLACGDPPAAWRAMKEAVRRFG